LSLLSLFAYCQDSTDLHLLKLADRYTEKVNDKVGAFNHEIEKQTEKALDRILKEEKKLKKKVGKIDSLKAARLFDYSIDSLKKLQSILKSKTDKITGKLQGDYFPYSDTLTQSLSFLKKTIIGTEADKIKNKLNSTLDLTGQMQSKLAAVEQVNEYLKQRKEVLLSNLSGMVGLTKNIDKIKKEVWYYRSRIAEAKNTLKDPDKIERVVLNALQKVPAFQKFLQSNSQLSGLFAAPASFPSIASGPSTPVVNGLPPRADVQQAIQNAFPSTGGNVTGMVQQQVSNAGTELNNLQDKINLLGGMGNKEMPDFTPNTQRTKSFRKRLEYGINIQFGRAVNFLPASCDIGFQVGYKLNDKNSIGVGTAYTIGLGTGWNHINLTNESVGLRTYVKTKLKGQFYLQGGGEWNYRMQFKSLRELKNYQVWQSSALLGLVKNYKIGKKISGNVQLLYDFLYRQHNPVSQPLLFRVGYNF